MYLTNGRQPLILRHIYTEKNEMVSRQKIIREEKPLDQWGRAGSCSAQSSCWQAGPCSRQVGSSLRRIKEGTGQVVFLLLIVLSLYFLFCRLCISHFVVFVLPTLSSSYCPFCLIRTSPLASNFCLWIHTESQILKFWNSTRTTSLPFAIYLTQRDILCRLAL
jgi:hypothetical protein